jgi:hypothetical protein
MSMLTKNLAVPNVAEPADASEKPRRRGRPKGTRRRNNPLWWAHFLVTVLLTRPHRRRPKPLTKSEIARLIRTTSNWPEYRHVTVGRLRQYLSHPDYFDLPTEERFKFVMQMMLYFAFIFSHVIVSLEAEIDRNPRMKPKTDEPPALQAKLGRLIAQISGEMILAAWKELQMQRKAEGKPLLPKSYFEQEFNKAALLPPCPEFALPACLRSTQLSKRTKNLNVFSRG